MLVQTKFHKNASVCSGNFEPSSRAWCHLTLCHALLLFHMKNYIDPFLKLSVSNWEAPFLVHILSQEFGRKGCHLWLEYPDSINPHSSGSELCNWDTLKYTICRLEIGLCSWILSTFFTILQWFTCIWVSILAYIDSPWVSVSSMSLWTSGIPGDPRG